MMSRKVINHGDGWYTYEGDALYYRYSKNDDGDITYFDPENGPFLQVGGEFREYGKISSLYIEDSPANKFKVRIQTER